MLHVSWHVGVALRVSFSPGGTLGIYIEEKYGAAWMRNEEGQEWTGPLWYRFRGNSITKGGTSMKDRQNRAREWLEGAGVDVEFIENWSVTVATSS